MTYKRLVVISGVNIVDGGALSVFKDALQEIASSQLNERFKFMILVNSCQLFKEFQGAFEFREYPEAKKSWVKRIYTEYWKFRHDFREEHVYWWLSMHDMSPWVVAEYQAVYCHNPTPFFHMNIRDAKNDPKVYMFSKLYKYLYRINIKANSYVIVQQDWIACEFEKMYGINKVLVARPDVPIKGLNRINNAASKDGITRFVYPAYPRVFKNIELVCCAAQELVAEGIDDFEISLTIDGSENKYSEQIVDQYRDLPQLKFIGIQSREEVCELYSQCDALVFPSKLETWGLPITEFAETGKVMLLADLPYAHEASSGYTNKAFFRVDDSKSLSLFMSNVIDGCSYNNNEQLNTKHTPIHGWKSLFEILLNESH